MYLPMIGPAVFSWLRGSALRSVRIACARAEPHLQERPPATCARLRGSRFCDVFRVLRSRFSMISSSGDGVVLRMPAIVVGDHGQRRVANFGFARKLGFGEIRHANHVETVSWR